MRLLSEGVSYDFTLLRRSAEPAQSREALWRVSVCVRKADGLVYFGIVCHIPGGLGYGVKCRVRAGEGEGEAFCSLMLSVCRNTVLVLRLAVLCICMYQLEARVAFRWI